MRILLAALFLVFAAGATWFVLTPDGDGVVGQEETAALAPRGGLRTSAPAAGKQPAAGPETLVAKKSAPVQNTTPRPVSTTRTLDGVVTDRFGAPLPSERVWLLPAGAGHPPEGTELTAFVTARTSRAGAFSLSLPNEGPWSLGVGEPGAPRVPPSTPRTMTGATHADVYVPGAAGLTVSFDSLPEGRVSLELMTLRPPGETGGGNLGGGRFNRGGAGRGNRGGDAEGGGRRGRGGGRGGGGNGGDGNGGGGGGQALLAPVPDARAGVAASWQDGSQDPGGQGSGEAGGRRRGFRGPGDTNPGATQETPTPRPEGRRRGGNEGDAGADDLPTGPPEEVWRATRRVSVTDEHRAAGLVRFEGVPVGWVGRIDLVMERDRYEGAQRFGLQADAITEVKLMPFEPREGAVLVYSAVARPLRVAESPPGVHFRE